MNIYVVDAFTRQPFKGNPAGVCIVKEFHSDEFMQSLSAELGFTNSAFVKKIDDNYFHIRWFTPISEAPLCGHATIAAMHILAQENLINKDIDVKFKSLSGPLTANITDSWYNLNFPSYPVKPVELSSELRDVVNIDPIFTGFAQNCYLMEFQDEDQLLKLTPQLELLKKIKCRALIATAAGRKYDFHSRYFAPSVGINEDPVCASAHCRLIPYWSAKLKKNELIAYQLSSRGGELKCKNLANRVLISGEAVTVMVAKLQKNLILC